MCPISPNVPPSPSSSLPSPRPARASRVVPIVAALAMAVAVVPTHAQIDVPSVKTSPKLRMNIGGSNAKAADLATAASGPASQAAKGQAASRAASAASAASAATIAGRATSPTALQDPMDRLRERLAEKLGAQGADGGKSKYVLRVSTHGESGESTVSARPGASAGTAAAMAAARRAEATHAGATAGVHAGADPHVPGLGPTHWDYDGAAGPAAWSRLKPEYAACGNGTRQSPIDIRGGIQVDLAPIQFEYRASGFGVIDNGHTIQVNVAPGNAISVMGRRYDLVQFHFHRPSEERVDGRQFDMVAHLVHQDAEGRLAVVSVLLDRGSAQPLVQTIWNNLPLEKGEELRAPGTIDLNGLLPEDRRYYTYMGSLTTPPCSEGVLWMVMKQPVGISPEQVGIFARLYPMNARPIQQAAGRLIKESN